MRYFVLALLPLSLASCATPNSKPAPAVLTISATPQQTMRGWGIYPCTIQNDRPNAQLYTLWKRPNAARLIWRDLGATYWRSEILPGSYDAKRDDGSLDEKYLDESLVRQIKLARSFGQTRYAVDFDRKLYLGRTSVAALIFFPHELNFGSGTSLAV